MQHKLEQIKIDIAKIFRENYMVTNSDDLDSLKNDLDFSIDMFVKANKIDTYSLSSVEVKGGENTGEILVNFAPAFKHFPKYMQEAILCDMHGIPRKSVKDFVYNKEGYIDHIVLKDMEVQEMTLEVEEC